MPILPSGRRILTGIIGGLKTQSSKFDTPLKNAQTTYRDAIQQVQPLSPNDRVEITLNALSELSERLGLNLTQDSVRLLRKNLAEFLESEVGQELVKLGLPYEQAVLRSVESQIPVTTAALEELQNLLRTSPYFDVLVKVEGGIRALLPKLLSVSSLQNSVTAASNNLEGFLVQLLDLREQKKVNILPTTPSRNLLGRGGNSLYFPTTLLDGISGLVNQSSAPQSLKDQLPSDYSLVDEPDYMIVSQRAEGSNRVGAGKVYGWRTQWRPANYARAKLPQLWGDRANPFSINFVGPPETLFSKTAVKPTETTQPVIGSLEYRIQQLTDLLGKLGIKKIQEPPFILEFNPFEYGGTKFFELNVDLPKGAEGNRNTKIELLEKLFETLGSKKIKSQLNTVGLTGEIVYNEQKEPVGVSIIRVDGGGLSLSESQVELLRDVINNSPDLSKFFRCEAVGLRILDAKLDSFLQALQKQNIRFKLSRYEGGSKEFELQDLQDGSPFQGEQRLELIQFLFEKAGLKFTNVSINQPEGTPGVYKVIPNEGGTVEQLDELAKAISSFNDTLTK